MEKSNQVQQDSNLSIYERVRCVPNEAKKEIEAGRLKGKHDINPMWRIKALTEVFGPIPSSEAMELGHHMEPAVVTMFAARTGAFIVKSSEGDWIAADTKRDYLRVSPDRLFYADGDKHTKKNLRILECKTTSVSVDPDDFPVYWYCQLQYQMGVMGVKKGAVAWISSYPGGNSSGRHQLRGLSHQESDSKDRRGASG